MFGDAFTEFLLVWNQTLHFVLHQPINLYVNQYQPRDSSSSIVTLLSVDSLMPSVFFAITLRSATPCRKVNQCSNRVGKKGKGIPYMVQALDLELTRSKQSALR